MDTRITKAASVASLQVSSMSIWRGGGGWVDPLALSQGAVVAKVEGSDRLINLLSISPCTLRRPCAQEGLLQPGQGEAGDFEDAEEGGFYRVINTRVVLSGVLCFCGTLVFGVVEPNLALHLKMDVGLTQTFIGGIFAGAWNNKPTNAFFI